MKVVSIRTFRDFKLVDTSALVTASQEEGFSMVDRLVNDFASGANRFDGPGECLLGAYYNGRLVGVAGVNHWPAISDTTGRIRHVYVLPRVRGKGIGKVLIQALIQVTRRSFNHLVLRTDTEPAAAFYEAIGFQPTSAYADVTHEIRVMTDKLWGPTIRP